MGRGSAPPIRRRAPPKREWLHPQGRSCGGQPDHETRAGDFGIAFGVGRTGTVLGADAAAMRFDDLLGDRQAESGVLAEALMRAVGVEALEDLVERAGPDTRAVIIDRDLDF